MTFYPEMVKQTEFYLALAARDVVQTPKMADLAQLDWHSSRSVSLTVEHYKTRTNKVSSKNLG